jgi:hypothetical protein
MFISNTLPQTDINQQVTIKVLNEIQDRLDNGYRLRNDMQLLLNYAKQTLEN